MQWKLNNVSEHCDGYFKAPIALLSSTWPAASGCNATYLTFDASKCW